MRRYLAEFGVMGGHGRREREFSSCRRSHRRPSGAGRACKPGAAGGSQGGCKAAQSNAAVCGLRRIIAAASCTA